MPHAVVPDAGGSGAAGTAPPAGGVLRALAGDGAPTGAPRHSADLAAAVSVVESADHPRWVWPCTAGIYPALLRAGVRVERCHDPELTEALLLGYAGRWGEPRSVAASWARARGLPVPPDPPVHAAPPPHGQEALFDPVAPPGPGPEVLDRLIAVYADQRRRIAATERPGRFGLLVAAESAGALVAAEMAHEGLPWRADIHDALLVRLLGEPSPVGGAPRRLAHLAERIATALDQRGLHPDSPAEVLRAFSRAGIRLPSTRAAVLRGVDHPAVPLLLEYKELYRIWTAHGWSWREQWVRDGRFHPEYVPAGVVSGRWATRGGGALQIPRVVRAAVVADPGWRLVVADASQLEPRVLAAVSGDAGLATTAAGGDLYAALAAEAFNGDRAQAKLALLGAMYGQTGGSALPALAVLRGRYPAALEYVEAAARTGEAGGLVRSWLGRTCPPAAASFRTAPVLEAPDGAGGDPAAAAARDTRAAARARGRFTRNFVIQATAAEWALTLLAMVRAELSGSAARLVFFQHDEVLVHAPAELAGQVAALVRDSAERAGRLLFGDCPVRFPMDVSIVNCYAEAG